MKTTHVETSEVKKEVVDSFICNNCGESFHAKHIAMDYYENSQIHNFVTSFHYGSKYDCESINFDLCEKCLLEMIKKFKVKPVAKTGKIIDGE
jgi:ribosomal protein L32